MNRAGVPEASVDEYRHGGPDEDDVGSAARVGQQLPVEAEP
jgi:hypothetical protein